MLFCYTDLKCSTSTSIDNHINFVRFSFFLPLWVCFWIWKGKRASCSLAGKFSRLVRFVFLFLLSSTFNICSYSWGISAKILWCNFFLCLEVIDYLISSNFLLMWQPNGTKNVWLYLSFAYSAAYQDESLEGRKVFLWVFWQWIWTCTKAVFSWKGNDWYFWIQPFLVLKRLFWTNHKREKKLKIWLFGLVF